MPHHLLKKINLWILTKWKKGKNGNKNKKNHINWDLYLDGEQTRTKTQKIHSSITQSILSHSHYKHKDLQRFKSQRLSTNTKTLHTFIQISRPNKANPNENQIAKIQSYTVDRRERESEMSLGLALLLWWLSWRCSWGRDRISI